MDFRAGFLTLLFWGGTFVLFGTGIGAIRGRALRGAQLASLVLAAVLMVWGLVSVSGWIGANGRWLILR